MPRILFTKTGESVWMSHLDLMRLFQRAFKRAGLPLTHTQGFNPRPSVSIALPLSVGVESNCELLDFDLTEKVESCDEITRRLNLALVPGVQVLKTYEDGRKIKELAYLQCDLVLEYDCAVPAGAEQAIRALFARGSLIVEKKGKNGPTQQDIIPALRYIDVKLENTHILRVCALVCCQNPSLNPMQLVTAINTYLPEFTPDFTHVRRIEIFDSKEMIFR